MNCPRCGTSLNAASTFCPQCSLPLQAPPPPPGSDSPPVPEHAQTPPPSDSPQGVPVYAQPNAAPAPDPDAVPPDQQGIASQPGAAAPPPVSPLPETPPSASAEDPLIRGEGEQEEKAEDEKEESENERLLIFSDALVAFAITIAAVPLKVPKETNFTTTFWYELFSYLFGYFLVYSLWRDHHSIFQYLKRNKTWLVTLNTLFLVLIVLIPIGFIVTVSGGITNTNSLDQEHSTTIAYGIFLFLGSTFFAGILLLLIWTSGGGRRGRLFGKEAPEGPFVVYMTRRLTIHVVSIAAYTIIFFLLLFGLANGALLYAALGVFVVLLVLQSLVVGLYRRRHRDVLHKYLGREETARLQIFSDAIFAVAITVTIAQIDPVADYHEIWSLVGTFLFSLVFLVVFWLLHYRLFHNVRRLNGTLIILNFIFLLLVILDFLPARLYTPHMGDIGSSVFFSIYQLSIAGLLWLMWIYVCRHKPHQEPVPSLIKQGLVQYRTRRLTWLLGVHPLIFLFLAIVALFKPIYTLYYVATYLILLGLAWLGITRLQAGKAHLSQEAEGETRRNQNQSVQNPHERPEEDSLQSSQLP